MRLGLALLLFATVASAQSYEKRYAVFRKNIGRPTLRKRVDGIEYLASTGDVRALQVLMKVYAKPPSEPRDQTRYIVASIAWENMAEPEHVAGWEKWRTSHTKAADAWLWYRALDVLTMHRGAEPAMAIAKSKGNIFHRAAAIHAIGAYHEPLILPFIPPFLEKRTERGLDRSLLIEACARALVRQAHAMGSEEFRAAALKLMKQFDLKETPDRTRWILARCFARIFKTKTIYLDSSVPWRRMLAAEDAKKVKIDPRYAPPKRPTFVGIEATGKRIAYVIDLSDSMLTPLTPREQNLMKGPVSGTSKKKGKGTPKKKQDDQSPLAGEKDLDWKKIKTRFDAAREYLIVSLRSLKPDMHYSVIWFGDKAGFLSSTRGLVKASSGNVNSTIKELRAIRAGSKTDSRPHGTLKGKTNFHGGLRRAFMLKGKATAKKHEYVDKKTFVTGCDTIFVLSDGDPSWDDWAGTDSRDPGDQVGDVEMGGNVESDAQTLVFPGPYARNRHLLQDVRRMNMFRQVEIHCVGIGEASRGFLSQIAGAGLGHVRMIGKGPSHRAVDKKKK